MTKWRHRAAATIVLPLLLFMGGPAPSFAASQDLASCTMRAAAALAFNGAIYVQYEGEVVERFFGTSDVAGRTPISEDTRFDIGSAGKMFTAVAIGLLVDRGAVELGAPVGRYLEGLDAPLAAVTIAQLLEHTSGLGDYLDPRNKAQIESATTATELLPLAIATPLAFAPGSRRAYSNSGFVVLGAVIEKVSGQSYARFIAHEVLEPLNMTNTSLEREQSADPLTHMSPEGKTVNVRLSPLRLRHASPAGGIFSTGRDLSLFLSAIQEWRLVSRRTLDRMLAPRPDPSGRDRPYGLGFVTRAEPRARVGHGGGAPGVNAEVDFFPESGWQLIALSNNDPPSATRMVEVMEQAIFASDLQAACARAIDSAIGPVPPHH